MTDPDELRRISEKRSLTRREARAALKSAAAEITRLRRGSVEERLDAVEEITASLLKLVGNVLNREKSRVRDDVFETLRQKKPR